MSTSFVLFYFCFYYFCDEFYFRVSYKKKKKKKNVIFIFCFNINKTTQLNDMMFCITFERVNMKKNQSMYQEGQNTINSIY